MCNIWKKRPGDELSLREIEKFFKRSNRFSWVGITGGEPFLKDDAGEVIKIIRDTCRELVAIHFATNGTCTDKIIETIKDAANYRKNKCSLVFTLSIDGPPSLHDDIRGVRGSWDRCLETFKALKEIASVRPRIGITLSRNNLNKFQDTFASLKKAYPPLRFDDITINIFQKSSFYYENQEMGDLSTLDTAAVIEDIRKIDRDTFTINNFLRRNYLKLYKYYAKHKKCPLRCQALSATCIMEPQGDIYPCGVYGVRVANIKEFDYSLKGLWRHPTVKALSAKCARGICPACWSPCDAYSAIAGSLLRYGLWSRCAIKI